MQASQAGPVPNRDTAKETHENTHAYTKMQRARAGEREGPHRCRRSRAALAAPEKELWRPPTTTSVIGVFVLGFCELFSERISRASEREKERRRRRRTSPKEILALFRVRLGRPTFSSPSAIIIIKFSVSLSPSRLASFALFVCIMCVFMYNCIISPILSPQVLCSIALTHSSVFIKQDRHASLLTYISRY